MINNKYLIIFLAFLIFMDYGTTFIAVLYMNATEINPFFKYFNTLYEWFIFKFIAGVFCLACIAWFEESNMKILNIGLLTLNIFYLIVVISNCYQIFSNI